MTKKRFLPIAGVFGCLLLFSFRSMHTHSTGTIPSVSTIHSIADTGGRVVRIDSAQACILRYKTEMKKHGFTDQAGQPIDIHLTTSSQITTGEVFSGKQLQNWLNATAATYSAAGKTLMINVQFGIYDSKYLNTYQPNAALRSSNNNRIAIFLIPYDSTAGMQSMVAQPNSTGPTPPPGGGTGYDMGGLQP